jgi:hypothetical protein
VRGTIIGVFSVVVLIVTIASLMAMRGTVGDVSNKGESKRAVKAAVAQLQVEGLRIERWLVVQTNLEETREPFKAGAAKARSESATTTTNTIEQRTKNDPAFAALRPTIIVLFDTKGVVLGRNGSNLMRGEKLGERYPEMLKTINAGNTGSSVWVDKKHNEQMLASYAPIREGAEVIGGIAVGTAFNNERLTSTSNATSGSALFALVPAEAGLVTIANSDKADDALGKTLEAAHKEMNADALDLGESLDAFGSPLLGYGDGKQALVVAATPSLNIGSFSSLFLVGLFVFLAGMVMVAVGAHLVDQYISQPVSDLEDGLLAVINGQTDLRFELEHKVLGGLVFRVNTLLNQLLGVKEDDTDDHGRPSVSPSSASFTAALNVDERMVSLSASDIEDAAKLQEEPPEDYYKRIFDEYVAAKKSMGDPVDQLKFAPFSQRIKTLEQQLAGKHGKPFRYQVEQKGKEVVFVAIPLT